MDTTTTMTAPMGNVSKPLGNHIHHYVKDSRHLSCWCGKRMYQRDGGYTTDVVPQTGAKVRCPGCHHEFEVTIQGGN